MKIGDYIQNKFAKKDKSAQTQTPDVYYKLNDLVWIDNWVPGNDDKALNVPFLPNKDTTKYKNILNGNIVELPNFYKGSNPRGNTLAKSLGYNDISGLRVATSADVLYGCLLLDKQPSSQVIKELKADLLKHNSAPDKIMGVISKFCENNKIAGRDLENLVKTIQSERNRTIRASIEHNEEMNRETLSRDF